MASDLDPSDSLSLPHLLCKQIHPYRQCRKPCFVYFTFLVLKLWHSQCSLVTSFCQGMRNKLLLWALYFRLNVTCPFQLVWGPHIRSHIFTLGFGGISVSYSWVTNWGDLQKSVGHSCNLLCHSLPKPRARTLSWSRGMGMCAESGAETDKQMSRMIQCVLKNVRELVLWFPSREPCSQKKNARHKDKAGQETQGLEFRLI